MNPLYKIFIGLALTCLLSSGGSPSQVTVPWAKRALQGFKLKVWISNQMALGKAAWDGTPADGYGLEYPTGSGIEHLTGAGPWIGAMIGGFPRVIEGYNEDDARKEILPQQGDTVRDRIWITSLDSLSQPNRGGLDDDGDGRIDEDDLDGTDNDGDWNILTDDVGADGIPDSLEVGCTGGYDPVTNPDPAYDNYDPLGYDSCRVNSGGTHPRKNDKTSYTEKNRIPDHGEPHVDEDYAAWSDNDLYCAATDTFLFPTAISHPIPMGVKVVQKSYAWKASISTEAFVIQEYDMYNIGARDWLGASAGLFADMDVGSVGTTGYYAHNYAAYDSVTRTAYVHNPVDNGSTPLGITLLGTSSPLDSIRLVFRWYDLNMHPGPGTIDSMIYKWMSCDSSASCFDSNQSLTALSDTRIYLGISGFTLHPRNAVKLYYAIVSGTSIAEMLDNVRRAQAVYDSTLVVGVEDRPEIMRHSFVLYQNYPNPFNPTTVIRFKLPEKGFTTLSIYDVLGREVSRLVNEVRQSGEYKIWWDASNLPSGVYFYRVLSGTFIQTKKLLFIR